MENVPENGIEGIPWHLGVFDAHCHPTDTMSSISSIPGMKARALTIMATRAEDQRLVQEVASELGVRSKISEEWIDGSKVVPSFGWHPWFSHQLFDDAAYAGKKTLDEEAKSRHYQSVLTPSPEDKEFLLALPDPRPLSTFIQETRDKLHQNSLALVGEIGLDRSFRLPDAWIPEHHDQRDGTLTPGGREGRRLSPFRVDMDHQRKILKAQLHLAGELGRPVSMHGVQAHGVIFDTIEETWRGHERKVLSKRQKKRQEGPGDTFTKNGDENGEQTANGSKPFPPRICLHSYSGPVEPVKQYLHPTVPAEVFFSFSAVINFSNSGHSKAEDVIKALPDDRILVESDIHMAGEEMDRLLADIIRKVCCIKGWDLVQGVQQLRSNYLHFAFGKG